LGFGGCRRPNPTSNGRRCLEVLDKICERTWRRSWITRIPTNSDSQRTSGFARSVSTTHRRGAGRTRPTLQDCSARPLCDFAVQQGWLGDRASWRGKRSRTVQTLGNLARRSLVGGGRRNERHWNMPCRWTTGDRSSLTTLSGSAYQPQLLRRPIFDGNGELLAFWMFRPS